MVLDLESRRSSRTDEGDGSLSLLLQDVGSNGLMSRVQGSIGDGHALGVQHGGREGLDLLSCTGIEGWVLRDAVGLYDGVGGWVGSGLHHGLSEGGLRCSED